MVKVLRGADSPRVRATLVPLQLNDRDESEAEKAKTRKEETAISGWWQVGVRHCVFFCCGRLEG